LYWLNGTIYHVPKLKGKKFFERGMVGTTDEHRKNPLAASRGVPVPGMKAKVKYHKGWVRGWLAYRLDLRENLLQSGAFHYLLLKLLLRADEERDACPKNL